MAGVLNNPDLVATIYAITGSIFLFALFAGFARTLARVVYYLRNKSQRPRLLNRDVVVIGGLSVSFGLITLIRFLPPETRIALTQGNVVWALVTSVPACVAVCVYLYFEYAVIERRSK
jgi:hypothetical protein